MKLEERIEKAYDLRKQGYNCAQAVLGVYVDVCPELTFEQAMKITYGFGRGVGGMCEICGCISGGAMVISYVHGKEEADIEQKALINQKIREFSEAFKESEGSTNCGELLELRDRNPEIANKKCNPYIVKAISLLEEYI